MTKKEIIKKIQAIIAEFGSFTTADVQAVSSPILKTIGKNTCQLAEGFLHDKVEAVLYVHESETDSEFISYHDLKKDVLEEILFLAEQYEADELQTEKRCSNGY